jgi:Holliday junction DNA helicase RuvA
MIAQLRGTLGDKRPNQVLVDVGGVGYLVHIPLSTFYALGDLHSNITLLIHTQVREDAISLYGFLSAREKHLFELLISASGVGPVLALKILSGMSVDDLVPAVRSGDLARLTRIPGVGRKTAERMIVELRDKLAAMEIPEEVVFALTNLGYDRSVAENAVEAVRNNGNAIDFEPLLRASLHRLRNPKARAGRTSE